MANGNVVTERKRVTARVVVAGVSNVQNRAILNAAAAADTDFMHITADNGHRPYRAIVAHLNIANHHRAGVYPATLAENWCGTLVRTYVSHYIYLYSVYPKAGGAAERERCQNTLEHIHVALGLRHPWLRTVLATFSLSHCLASVQTTKLPHKFIAEKGTYE